MNCPCEEQPVDAGAVGPTAVALLEYLIRRQRLPRRDDIVDVDATVDEWLIEARAARLRFRRLATPALRSLRQRAATRATDGEYQNLVKRYAGKTTPVLQLFDDAIRADEVSAILERHNVRPGLIKSVRSMIKQSETSLVVDEGRLVLVTPHHKRTLLNDAGSPSKPGQQDLLNQIANSWTRHGRGLTTLAIGPRSQVPEQLSWKDGFAHALVNCAWLFDRDTRDIEDLRSLPLIEGNADPGLLVVGAAVLVAVLALTIIADCVEDDNPGLAETLRTIAKVMTFIGIVTLVKGGAPVSACRTVDGVRRCAPVGGGSI